MKIDHPITVIDFQIAAGNLKDGEELRLREDGKGFATTSGERFCVAFCDLFRWGNSLPLKKQEVIQTYLDAVQRQYGEDIAFFQSGRAHQYTGIKDDAARYLHSALQPSMVLDRTKMLEIVDGFKEHLGRLGVLVKQKNEKIIKGAAHFFDPPSHLPLSLSRIFNRVVTKFQKDAEKQQLGPDVIAVLATKTLTRNQMEPAFLDIPGVSGAIEEALREKMSRPVPEGSACPIYELNEPEALTIGMAAVERVLARELMA